MMYRRTSSTPEEQEVLEARIRLLLAGGGSGTDVTSTRIAADGRHQQQQLQLLREQQIMLEARAVAMAGQHQHQQQQQLQHRQQQQLLSSLSFPSSSSGAAGVAATGFPSRLEQLEHQQRLQQLQIQQHQYWDAAGLARRNSGEQDQRVASIQLAQLEFQRHAIAQAQAEARMKALLADHEAQVAQDQLRLQSLRQRQQLASPSSASNYGVSAYDALAAGAGRSFERLSSGGLERLSSGGGRDSAGDSVASLEAHSLSATRLLQQQQYFARQQRAQMLGFGGSQVRAPTGALMPASTNLTPTDGQGTSQNTNVTLAPSAREESMVFGKISRQTSEGAGVDVALPLQSRRDGKKKKGRADDDDQDNSKHDDDQTYDWQERKTQGVEARVGVEDDQGPDEEGEEADRWDDDEYYRRCKPGDKKDSDVDNIANESPSPYPMTREAFPLKLYRILYEARQNGQEDIISFFPHGRAFAVHKANEFTRDVMPKYFPAGRMNTFLKQLNLYGFVRITEGKDKGGKYIATKR
jgi:HSF-type DNA-binding